MQILVLSLVHIFLFTSLNFFKKIWLRENSVQLSLLVNLGTTFFSVAHAKFYALRGKLAALTSSIFFFYAAKGNSVHLW